MLVGGSLEIGAAIRGALGYRGWLGQLFTHGVRGLESFGEIFEILEPGTGVIKVFCEVADEAAVPERVMTRAGATEVVGAA